MTQKETDEVMMKRALKLAAEGIGLVSPNPLVGCVIVAPNGEVVGEGTYILSGVTHAEVIALEKAGQMARGATAYVTLEPHAHHGKTPPCTDALIRAGIKRVVAPMEDPNPLVSGAGFRRLREQGIEVVTGVLAAEGEKINEKFRVWHEKGRPFVHLKLAMSLDGRISLNDSVSTALSGDAARRRVQDLRHEHDAILVGSNTAIVDDPALTDRSGKPRRRKLLRVVLDRRLRMRGDMQLVRTANECPTVVFTDTANISRAGTLESSGAEIVGVDGASDFLTAVLNELKRREIQSVLVEGGTAVAGAFCDARLVDKITFLVAPLIIGGAAPAAIGGRGADTLASAMHLESFQADKVGDDLEITGYPSPA